MVTPRKAPRSNMGRSGSSNAARPNRQAVNNGQGRSSMRAMNGERGSNVARPSVRTVNPSAYERQTYRYATARQAQANRRKKKFILGGACVVILALLVGVFGFGFAGFGNDGDSADSGEDASVLPFASEPEDDPGDIIIGVNGDDETYVLQGEGYVEGGAHASSQSAGVLTPNIKVSGNVDTGTAGDYTVTYKASDDNGHTATAKRTVHVVESMDTMQDGVPVLMYHYVYSADNPPSDLNGNYILDTDLDEQMQYLEDNNFYYPSFPEVQAFLKGEHSLPANSVVLTFDDGEEGFLSLGVPLAEKHGIPVTSFMICSDEADATRKVLQYANPYLEFESHSCTMHQPGGTVGHGGRISAMTKDEIVEDLQKSGSIVGSSQAFAYPFGDTTADGRSAMNEAGVLCAFTTENAWDSIGDDVTALSRVRISGEYTLDSFKALVTE